AEEERPGGVAVQHHDGLPAALVEVVEAHAAAVEEVALERVEVRAHHSTPSIRQLSPEPMPRKPTRSPGRRNSRSSARAAVRGSDTVPMLPRYSKVEKSLLREMPRALRMESRWGVPTWWQMTLSTVSAAQPRRPRNAFQVRRPMSTPNLSTATESVD